MNKGLKIPLIASGWQRCCRAWHWRCTQHVAVGEVDAILKFCAKTDPRLAASAERHLTVLTGVASPGARGTAQYKQGYDLVSDALAKVSKRRRSPRVRCWPARLRTRGETGRHR